MATFSTHPLGPVSAIPEIEPTTVLKGGEREAMLEQLTLRSVSAEDELLFVDKLDQPWVDRPTTRADERELVQVCWKEVCLNWPDALCAEELEK
jgi:hypothetical protein